MTSLTEFLLARIAEDEAIAKSAGSDAHVTGYSRDVRYESHPPNGEALFRWRVAHGGKSIDGTQWVEERGGSQHVIRAYSLALAEHAARFDPARALAECEAKRRIVELWDSEVEIGGEDPEPDNMPDEIYTGIMYALRDVLRLLALPYADHPEFQQEWRP